MTKATPMSLSEFAEYSAAVTKDQHEDYNRMLSFVENVVMKKAAKLVCSDCMNDYAVRLSDGHHFHDLNFTSYLCRADGIYRHQSQVPRKESFAMDIRPIENEMDSAAATNNDLH